MRQWLALDKRSLALFRILVGLVLTLDVALRLPYFRAHYTNVGLVPLKDYLLQPDLTYRRWSVFYLNDNPWFVFSLLALFLVCSICLTLGYRTRWMGWVCLILLWGIYRRNPVLNNSGDTYLPLLLLWGNFLPWGEAFSVDSRGELSDEEAYCSTFPGFCYLIQVVNLYWFTAVLRSGPEWQVDYSALYYALHLNALSTRLAPYLLMMGTDLMSAITWVTIMLELFGPVLLIVPNPYCRFLGIFLIISFHLGILAVLLIPVFALACAVGPIGLLPSLFWHWRPGKAIARRLNGSFLWLRDRWPKSLQIGTKSEVPRVSAGLQQVYSWVTLPMMLMTVFYLWWGIHWPDDRSLLTSTLKAFSLDQRWGMFSPSPMSAMGWEAARARTESGREVNLITGKDYSEKPQDLENAVSLLEYRWRSFRASIAAEKYAHTAAYLRYLSREWDAKHPDDRIVAAQYVYLPESYPQRYLLGENRREVMSEYHR